MDYANIIPKRWLIIKELIKEKYKIGKRIVCDYMDDVQAVKPGTEGTISYVDDMGQIHVNWDCHSSLALIVGVDKFHLKEEK